jgi:hypothetical protein
VIRLLVKPERASAVGKQQDCSSPGIISRVLCASANQFLSQSACGRGVRRVVKQTEALNFCDGISGVDDLGGAFRGVSRRAEGDTRPRPFRSATSVTGPQVVQKAI